MSQTILTQPDVVKRPVSNGKVHHHLPTSFPKPLVTNKNGALDDDSIDWEAIIDTTEEPVDLLITEPHYSLLSDPLYDSWSHPIWDKQFMVATNVGIFSSPDIPGIAPDAFLSLGVVRKADMTHKKDRSYYIWVLGKVPEVAIEIVSNTVGKEDTTKKSRYEELGILYYIIYDPALYLQRKKRKINRTQQALYLYKLNEDGHYVEYHDTWLPEVNLGVTRWVGTQKGVTREYLRWCDEKSVPIPTGTEGREEQRLLVKEEHERAEEERLRAEQERFRAEQERLRAEAAEMQAAQAERQAQAAQSKAERLAAKLRALGIAEDDLA